MSDSFDKNDSFQYDPSEENVIKIGNKNYSLDEIESIFKGDPWPYGELENKLCIDTLVDYMLEQGIIGKRVSTNDLFISVK